MIAKLRNLCHTHAMTLTLIARWFAIMALLMVITALAQLIGGHRYGLTLASAVGFATGYGLHVMLVRRGW
jgi:hypothetical protein